MWTHFPAILKYHTLWGYIFPRPLTDWNLCQSQYLAYGAPSVTIGYPIATRSSPDRLRYCSENACKTNSTDQKSTDSEGYGHGLLGRVTEVVPSLVFRLGRQHQVSCLVLLFLSGKRQLRNSLISACERTFQPYWSTVPSGGTFFLSHWPIGICVRVGIWLVERLQWRSGGRSGTRSSPDRDQYCPKMLVKLILPIKKALTLRDMVMDCSGVYAEVASSSKFRSARQYQINC